MSSLIGHTKALLAVFCASIVLMAFVFTMPPGITWRNSGGDSGELATAVYYLGVAHPTGYPLYVLLGWPFAHLPFGEPAFNLNLYSAVSAAAAVVLCSALLWDTLASYPRLARMLGVVGGSLSLGFSPLLWSQAVIVEVYALHAAAIFLVLYLQEHLASRPFTLRGALLMGALVGVGAANHITVLLMALGALLRLIPLWPFRLHAVLKVAALAVGIAAGLSLYLLLLLFAWHAPSFASWGDTVTLNAWWVHVTGAAYRGAAFSLPPDVVLSRVPALARLLLEQFGWTGYLLMMIGWWGLFRDTRGFAVSLVVSASCFLVFALNYPVLNSKVYLIGFFSMLVPALGYGVAGSVRAFTGRFGAARWPAVAATTTVGVLLVAAFMIGRPKVDISNDTAASDFARGTLARMPQGALLFTQDDDRSFSLWYTAYVEGVRPDVVLIDTRLISWPWYQRNLLRTYPDIQLPCLHCFPLWEVPAIVLANAPERAAYGTFPRWGVPVVREGEGELYRYDPAAPLAGVAPAP